MLSPFRFYWVAFFLCGLAVGQESVNENRWVPNASYLVIKDSPLFRTPGGESIGVIPKQSVVTLVGEEEGEFISVEVELEDGLVGGWMEKVALAELSKVKQKATQKRSGRGKIPKDETLLLKREPKFFYGAQLGLSYSILQPESNANSYTGSGLLAGGYLGFFLSQEFPLRLEVNYNVLTGSHSDDPASPSIGFLDIGVFPTWLMKDFELWGGFQYSLGLSLEELPQGIAAMKASEFSQPWVVAGAGYRIYSGQLTSIVMRARYGLGLKRSPILFQSVGISLAAELKG